MFETNLIVVELSKTKKDNISEILALRGPERIEGKFLKN